ncbi:MAG: tRNA lysidine(34) synthetase TilS, partial [Gammaproteobacteria bacterium]|nr:tRNA lysidine(34) synthetase TilS [Gammaproteobacteria bacterium]
PRQRNVLRHWMLKLGFQPPGWQLMQRLTKEVLVSSKPGACLECEAGLIQRYGNQLLLFRAGANLVPANRGQKLQPAAEQLLLLDDNGELRVVFSETAEAAGNSCRLRADVDELVIGYRQEGERCRLSGRPTRPLKKILQESALAPWLRSRQPLIYSGGELVCIPGVGVCEGFTADPDQPGREIFWQTPELLFRSSFPVGG